MGLLIRTEKLTDETKGVQHSTDWSVAFAPEITYLGKPFDSSNGYLIARGEGVIGAEALVGVSMNEAFRNPGKVYLNDITEEDFERVSTLGGSDCYGGRFVVDGSWVDYCGVGFAVGVKCFEKN